MSQHNISNLKSVREKEAQYQLIYLYYVEKYFL